MQLNHAQPFKASFEEASSNMLRKTSSLLEIAKYLLRMVNFRFFAWKSKLLAKGLMALLEYLAQHCTEPMTTSGAVDTILPS